MNDFLKLIPALYSRDIVASLLHSGVLVMTVTCMERPVPGCLADVVKRSGDVRFGFRPVLERLRVKQGCAAFDGRGQ